MKQPVYKYFTGLRRVGTEKGKQNFGNRSCLEDVLEAFIVAELDAVVY